MKAEANVRLQQLEMTQQVEEQQRAGPGSNKPQRDPTVMHQWATHGDIDSTIKHKMETSGAHQQCYSVILLEGVWEKTQ